MDCKLLNTNKIKQTLSLYHFITIYGISEFRTTDVAWQRISEKENVETGCRQKWTKVVAHECAGHRRYEKRHEMPG